ncbi:hypothetical protein EUGRSUZ_A00463 [Eucalyptus grandis]|uniref:Uncharacterized protein n=2 Tax=Eucalyptus grandis TaxID=71139 RepID=A0ACC3M059_EUCGR|nr:hypothetical protein EUGRSUZ_A00463 [Eucalyptus grandis]
MDSKKLRKILGEGMTGNKWEDLLDQAKTCPVNEKNYMLHDNEGDHGVISDNPATDGVYRAAYTFFSQAEGNWEIPFFFPIFATQSARYNSLPHYRLNLLYIISSDHNLSCGVQMN